MTVLDAMIAVGGLTRYAAGNNSVIVRTINGQQNTYAVHLADLVRDGDIFEQCRTSTRRHSDYSATSFSLCRIVPERLIVTREIDHSAIVRRG
jgi:hypothetical protein